MELLSHRRFTKDKGIKIMKEIKIPIAWVERLKDYTDAVRESAKIKDDFHLRINISSLLGYLESLDIFVKS